MTVRLARLIAASAGAGVLSLAAGQAYACCAPPPPPCCKPPSPPKPPPTPCCGSGGHEIRVPGVNVYVAPSVVVNASASAVVNAAVNASGSASGSGSALGGVGSTVFIGGGGGGGFYAGPGSTGIIQGLNVDGGSRVVRTPYQATRTHVRIVTLRAVCVDDREVPHAASQVTPDQEIDESYEGELYRCLAGARLQYTLLDELAKTGAGQAVTCAKNEALYHGRGGRLECRPQKRARDCNERSLLRRYGAGVKRLKVVVVETYTAYREEVVQTASASSSFNMTIDGGVGGLIH